jgi:capsular exopolysaccharide synthesis family protein
MNSLQGLVAGVFIGIVFVLVRERVDRALKKPGDAPFYLDLPELGTIPGASAGTSSSESSRRGRRSVSLTLGIQSSSKNGKDKTSVQPSEKHLPESVELTCWLRKLSLEAECYRSVLTSILFTGCNGDRPRVLVVTSPLPGEGKTTVASNIAITLAEINRSVLLIDADMRKPRLHDIFGLPNTWGLTDLLQSKDPIERSLPEVIAQETEIPNLHVLPSGPGTEGISTLLHSVRTVELIQRVREEFDTVVIDTPPMTHLADARVLGQLVGDIVLVLRAGHTTRDSARAAVDQLREDGTRVVGTILNDWKPNTSGNGHYDDYYRPYQKYYAEDSSRSER